MAGAYELQSPKDIAMEYGGNKQKIAQATQMGLIDPTSAVLAGMFIDRMRSAQQEEMAPNQTVAQQVLAPQMGAGLGATPQAAMAPQMPQQMPTDAGVAALPVPDEMVPSEYAGGGIIAFANGGETDPIFGMGQNMQGSVSRKELTDLMTLAELQQYNRTGVIPKRLENAIGGRLVEKGSFIGGLPFARQVAEFGEPTVPAAVAATIPVAPTAAPTAAPTVAPSEVALVTPQGQKLIPSQGLSVEDFKAQQKAFGISDNVDADLKQQIEALASGSKGDREQAKYMAMLQAGLGIMGGTSPYALQNISAGAQKGIAQYATDIKDIKKEERDLMKLQGELARAEDARKRGDFKTFQDANDKARKLEVDLYQAESGRMVAEAQKTRAAAAGSGITLSQMANLRMRAEKEVDPASIRNAIAKQKNLSKVPKPGENKKFDADVEAAYEAEIEKRVQRSLGGAARGSSGATRDLSGYRIVPEDDQ
jgi:hypothetical protein